MKFARTDLIARVGAEIARRNKVAADRTAEAAAKHEKARTEYVDRYGDAWLELATAVRRRARNGQPVTSTDLPKLLRDGFSRGYLRTFDDGDPATYTADTAALETLLDLLTSATDETISTSHLEAMGFRVARLFG